MPLRMCAATEPHRTTPFNFLEIEHT